MIRLQRMMAVAALALAIAVLPNHALAVDTAGVLPQPVSAKAPELTLAQALTLAESRNPGLWLARYQVNGARAALTAAPANAAALAPAVSLYARTQLGLTIPESAVTPVAAGRQAQISYEQAAAQYYDARQQVRLGTLQAYVEWQRATALVAAQQSALDRAVSQEAQVKVAFEVGSAARFDLLQVEAQVAGQRAALMGARALQASTRQALEQVLNAPLAADVMPAQSLVVSREVTLPTDLNQLTARALANRPDLRERQLDLMQRRLQTGLSTGAGSTALLQMQVAATQYEMAALKARTEVQQALAQAQSALEELKARELALGPATEAQRLAELRYGAGLATYLEVQSASASVLQAEASRIQAAANLTLSLARLKQATGEL